MGIGTVYGSHSLDAHFLLGKVKPTCIYLICQEPIFDVGRENIQDLTASARGSEVYINKSELEYR